MYKHFHQDVRLCGFSFERYVYSKFIRALYAYRPSEGLQQMAARKVTETSVIDFCY